MIADPEDYLVTCPHCYQQYINPHVSKENIPQVQGETTDN